MTRRVLLVAAVLLIPMGAAHVFNHEDRHEQCDIYDGPHGHYPGDGHAHSHTDEGLHDHDPCKQTRMDYPGYEHNAPLLEIPAAAHEIEIEDSLFSAGENQAVFTGGEAYSFPTNSAFKSQRNLVVLSDLQAAGMGFPGTGTYDDPYIIENYLITGNLILKNTDACFVLRNNVVVDRAAPAPLLPDPSNIIDLNALDPYFEALLAEAQQALADLDEAKATWEEEAKQWISTSEDLDIEKEELERQRAQTGASHDAMEAAQAAYEKEYLSAVREAERLAAEFAEFAKTYAEVEEPPKQHDSQIEGDEVKDYEELRSNFESYLLADAGGSLSLQGLVAQSEPPQEQPEDYDGDANAWEEQRQKFEAYEQAIADAVYYYQTELIAQAPDQSERAQRETAANDADAAYQAFLEQYHQFQEQHADFKVDYQAFQQSAAGQTSAANADIRSAEQHLAKSSEFGFEYHGVMGHMLFDDMRELAAEVIEQIFGIVNIDDPNNVAENTGRMVLDWNGQCVHVYNNVVHDLRVNQNNDRTGYATGGIIEHNRFFTIGQIRHYDGIFRHNEVGNRAHLHSLVDPNIAAPGDRSINNDGANQGWYYGNLIYGQVDLDFHGHHHSAGFFAPISHYHGSTPNVAYMQSSDGTCSADYETADQSKANGPYRDYPKDNDVELMGETMVDLPDREGCLPHMDHGKRWTSVFFNDNIVIDPAGVGLRFEDRNHRGDDEQANSENMAELKSPHFHQKWVQLEDNIVVGKLFVDVLNAAGTDLWSDDWSAVIAPPGPARIAESAAHPGATVINSHPYRNDAWLDIQGNTVLQTQSSGVLVRDASEMTLFQLKNNRGVALPSGMQEQSPEDLLQWIKNSGTRSVDDLYADVTAWGGDDRGHQSFATLMNLRDGFRVEHCGNAVRGLDAGLIATNRIMDDGESIILSCGPSDYLGADPAIDIRYKAAPKEQERFSEPLRAVTADSDDFYITESAYDVADTVVPADTWDLV